MKTIFVIEHLDPEVWDWSLIEYEHISHHIGKENVWFTNVKKDAAKLKGLGKIFSESVTEMNLQNACILESAGKETLTPADKKFDYLIIGGILGDYPEVDKSHAILKKMKKATVRNLGKDQMSTDNAALVAQKIINGTQITKIPFQKKVTIEINENESVDLPYKYILRNGEPHLPPGLVEHLKHRKSF